MPKYIDVDSSAYDYGTLVDWLISSVGPEPPVWTDAHIDELMNDFLIFPNDTPTADVVERPRWTPVTERLPEDYVYVLGRYKSDEMAVVCVFDHDEDMDFWRAQIEEGWVRACDDGPTHWMPLPKAPDVYTDTLDVLDASRETFPKPMDAKHYHPVMPDEVYNLCLRRIDELSELVKRSEAEREALCDFLNGYDPIYKEDE